MRKTELKLLFLLVLFVSVTTSKAQEKPLHIGLRYGLSLPMGQFASHEYNYGAYAMLGTSFSAQGVGYLKNGLGAGLHVSASYFPIATGYYLEDKLANDPSASSFMIKSGPYIVKNFMAGIFYRMPVYKRFSASFRGMGGVCRSFSPDQFYGGEYFMIGKLYWSKTPAQSTRLACLAGATLQYKLFDNVELILDSEFSYTESKFTFWIDGVTKTVNQFIQMPVFKIQPGLNITF